MVESNEWGACPTSNSPIMDVQPVEEAQTCGPDVSDTRATLPPANPARSFHCHPHPHPHTEVCTHLVPVNSRQNGAFEAERACKSFQEGATGLGMPSCGLNGSIAQGQRNLSQLYWSGKPRGLQLGGVCGRRQQDEMAWDLKGTMCHMAR
jgi:hypothetical protein